MKIDLIFFYWNWNLTMKLYIFENFNTHKFNCNFAMKLYIFEIFNT